MKHLEAILDELQKRGGQRRVQAVRDRAGIDLDEDLFSPAASSGQATPATADLDGRLWPVLDTPPMPGPSVLEKKIAEQERELSMRCTQVADLYNLQERQTAELQVAYAEIERLNAAFAELQGTATEHAMAAAERKKTTTALHQENAILRSKLEKSQNDIADLSNKMLTVETLFNDREMVITTALEQADLLKAELATAVEERSNLTKAIDEAEQINQSDRARTSATIDELNRKVESLFADHGIQLKTRDRLAKRCDELAKTVAALESENSDIKIKLSAQGEHTTFLEAVLRVERETAEARIKELTEKLEQERQQRAIADRASSAMRQEMAILLRHIARRRQAEGGKPETRQDAA